MQSLLFCLFSIKLFYLPFCFFWNIDRLLFFILPLNPPFLGEGHPGPKLNVLRAPDPEGFFFAMYGKAEYRESFLPLKPHFGGWLFNEWL